MDLMPQLRATTPGLLGMSLRAGKYRLALRLLGKNISWPSSILADLLLPDHEGKTVWTILQADKDCEPLVEMLLKSFPDLSKDSDAMVARSCTEASRIGSSTEPTIAIEEFTGLDYFGDDVTSFACKDEEVWERAWKYLANNPDLSAAWHDKNKYMWIKNSAKQKHPLVSLEGSRPNENITMLYWVKDKRYGERISPFKNCSSMEIRMDKEMERELSVEDCTKKGCVDNFSGNDSDSDYSDYSDSSDYSH